jgi:hypothetical protein
MAVVASAISGAILGNGQGIFPGSQTLPRIASAVGTSVVSWLPIPTNVLVQGATSGLVGAGAVSGKLTFTGGVGLIISGLTQAGVVGPSARGLGTAVGAGLAQVLNSSSQYSGTSAGVGSGTDTSKISVANSATLIPILLGNLQAAGVRGPQTSRLATGLGVGIAQLVRTGVGFGGVTGPAGSIPAVGTSVSLVF